MATEKSIKQEYDITNLKSDMEEIKASQVKINEKLDNGFEKVTKTMQNHHDRIQTLEISKKVEDQLKKDATTSSRWNVGTVITIISLLIAAVMMLEKFLT